MKTIFGLSCPFLLINLLGISFCQTDSLSSMLVEKPCCSSIQLKTSYSVGAQSSKLGVYSKVEGEEMNGRPVYQNDKFSFWRLFWCLDSWTIEELTRDTNKTTLTCGGGIKNKNPEGYFCPEDATAPWQYLGEDFIWTEIKEAKFECSDCSIHPDQQHCGKCCDTLSLTASHEGWTNNTFFTSNLQGNWRLSQTWLNGSPVYTSQNNQTFCVSRNICGYWQINTCDATEICTLEPAFSADGMGLKESPRCVEDAQDWRFGSNMEKDSTMGFSCLGNYEEEEKTLTGRH